MERRTGTISRGIRCPIIREGDDLAKIVCDSVVEAAECDGFELREKDVVAVTESILARSQGNYASVLAALTLAPSRAPGRWHMLSLSLQN